VESLRHWGGGVAHELNNVLGPLLAYPDLLAGHFKPGEAAYQDLMEIKRSAARAIDIVGDLQAISRMGETGSAAVPVSEVIDGVVREAAFRDLAEQQPDVSVAAKSAPDAGRVRVSMNRVGRALKTLLVNSLGSMPRGGDLTVSAENRTVSDGGVVAPGEYVLIRVHDTGVTLEPDHLPHVFEPYYVRKQTPRQSTGLGLLVVRVVLEDHGGAADVVSEEGYGTEFVLYLPRAG
jgi:signal transduction histidine kinase